MNAIGALPLCQLTPNNIIFTNWNPTARLSYSDVKVNLARRVISMTYRLPSHPTQDALADINEWLSHLDKFQLECDGMTRVISALLARAGVEHTVCTGYLENIKTASGIMHYWIELNDDYLIDLRARMWMGNQAPHGVFLNGNTHVNYQRHGVITDFKIDPYVFDIMTGESFESISPFPTEALSRLQENKPRSAFLLDQAGQPKRVFRGEHGVLEGNIQGLHSALSSYSFSSCAVANVYAQSANDRSLWGNEAQPRLIPCYLKMENPVFTRVDDPYVDFNDLVALMGTVEAMQLFTRLSDYVEDTNAFCEINEGFGIQSLAGLINTMPQMLEKLYVHTFRILDDDQFIAWCKENGYDGALHPGSGASMDAVEYRVFSEDQVVYCLSQIEPSIEPTVDAHSKKWVMAPEYS